MAESGIETAAAPDWLVKLESRREQIRGRLGHESGNGAPCIVCENKCPGLDLHFWRKVCRNCKCRKEQHDCKDEDVTGWAQFEILGAIRSKPAYIKISEFTDKPVQLDWIPPNVTPELASDYMSKLGQQNIPIAGSDAAEKRKQQLEYQVPPHDLDASLCHNLSESEALQLVQYVETIKKNCVGQGSVVRVGDNINYLSSSSKHPAMPSLAQTSNDKIMQLMTSEPMKELLTEDIPVNGNTICIQKQQMTADFNDSPYLSDKIKYKLKLMKINSEAIVSAVRNGPEIDKILNGLKSKGVQFQNVCNLLDPLDRFRQEYISNPKFHAEIDKYVATLSPSRIGTLTQHRENLFNSPVVPRNFVRHDTLQHQETPVRKLKFNQKTTQPFSRECRTAMKKDKVLADILSSEPLKTALMDPVSGSDLIISRDPLFPDFISSPFLSPSTKEKLERMKINTQMIQSAVLHGPIYDELLSKLENSGVNYAQDSILQPINEFRDELISYDSDNDFQKEIVDFVKNSDLSGFDITAAQVPQINENRKLAQNSNKLLAGILANPTVQDALNSKYQPGSVMKTSNTPLVGAIESQKLSQPTIEMLNEMNIDATALESAIVCGPIYDKLYNQLYKNRINFASDSVLGPIAQLRSEYLNNDSFRKELNRYILHPQTSLFEPATIEEITPAECGLAEQLSVIHISHSDDSGFGSVPPTPNYLTYPGIASPSDNIDINARDGVFSTIPAIQDMNMYPEISPSRFETRTASNLIDNPFHSHDKNYTVPTKAPETIVCYGCQQNITFGEVAVRAERAGKSAAWHPQCFKCHKCKELLADLVYFFHGGNVYCARDLANILKIPRCSACDELIFTKEYTAAEGATFHIKHFCCYHCDAALAGKQYVPDEKSNMPLCLTCYDTYFAKSCHFCRGNIGPAEQGVAWGNIHWHGSCFLCSGKGCGKSLIGGRFCVKNEMPFCSPQCLKSIIH
ncbi:uncharacterized protein LOC129765526 [Toxorhynchites rutilus septentrionalis]|uniref:uncharacterized protein LOC129765526 n=1 Tax=Toxorhynchites rutilus septentrionalis TaxID=329112 RepID=UPI002479B3DC|nr:uncharacterized protein LOC129765526 [Toxorhynchites rutilus septentrionalis]